MTPRQPFWEDSYGRAGRIDTFGGGKPSEPVKKTAAGLPAGAKVLDIGCGEGRNTLYLAALGFKVTAFDISVAGVGKILAIAKEKRLKINAFVADMREYVFTETYDLVVCVGCLHLITPEERKSVIIRLKETTVAGGYHVIGVLTDARPEPEDLKGIMVGLLKEGELFEHYNDWEIIEKAAYQFKDTHPGGISHEHAANEVIARKPL
jgi:tellurite methyltransferase